MKNTKFKYRITSIVLLFTILSHLSIFHFQLVDKVLCVGDENHFHIENIEDTHIEKNISFSTDNFKNIIHNVCRDYNLDKHIDANIVKKAKTSNLNLYKFIIIIFDQNDISNSFRTFTYNKSLNNNSSLESLSTITLII